MQSHTETYATEGYNNSAYVLNPNGVSPQGRGRSQTPTARGRNRLRKKSAGPRNISSNGPYREPSPGTQLFQMEYIPLHAPANPLPSPSRARLVPLASRDPSTSSVPNYGAYSDANPAAGQHSSVQALSSRARLLLVSLTPYERPICPH
jgi:hypothetical protein